MRINQRQLKQIHRGIIASVLTGIVLLLNAMAASPSLHEWFHADATDAGHHCAVTLFAHGQVDLAQIDVAPAARQIIASETPIIEFSHFTPAIDSLPAGRAPPASSANS